MELKNTTTILRCSSYFIKKDEKKENNTALKKSSNIQEQVAKETAKHQKKIYPSREDADMYSENSSTNKINYQPQAKS